MDFAIIGSLIAAAVGVAALVKVLQEGGARKYQLDQYGRDLKRAFDRIERLEACQHNTDLTLGEIRKDIEYIKAGIDELRGRPAPVRPKR